ncbi:GIY-YIG nuclease family protein [Vreelandella piezotolerans]|uniref:GIY-YIG nuclease family protein n=1 Tax=Vreelandella piezotolerans TaxID=2609667 RepID=UPI0037B102B9
MNDKKDIQQLVEYLEISERANDSFEYLIGELASLMEMASMYRIRGIFDPIAMIQYAGKIETTILASGHDPRVQRMCEVMLGLTGVSENEFRLGADGKVKQRQVYFARRSDGLIKIGSSMNVQQRIEQLSSGAAENLELLGHINGSTVFEKAVHQDLEKHKKHGEWFFGSAEVLSYIYGLIGAASQKTVH